MNVTKKIYIYMKFNNNKKSVNSLLTLLFYMNEKNNTVIMQTNYK
mgnify:CR=1 FL=1